jgi:hypothetical protein
MPITPPQHYHMPQAGPGPHAPTYQLLPAMKRKEKDSDWPLTVGLLVLAVIIAILIGAIAFGLVRTMRAGPRARTDSALTRPAH